MLDWLRSGQYQEFIMGFFAQHTAAIVATIGVGQLTAAVLMSLRGSAVCLGLVGAIICLIAVAPLGSGTAFPSTLITACAGILLLRYTYDSTLLGELIGVSHGAQPNKFIEAGAKPLKRETSLADHDPDAHLGHSGAE
jgi:hypothetical protein